MMSNSEDKLFEAVLKVAAEEALRQDMEETQLRKDSNQQYVPSPKHNKEITKIISNYNFKIRSLIYRKNTMRIVASSVFFMIITSTVMLSVEATRNYIFNAVLRWQENYFSLEHGETNDVDIIYYRMNYIPEGFTLSSQDITGNIIRTTYENEEGARIILKSYPSDNSNTLADLEEKNYTRIEINGQSGYLFEAIENDKNNILIWEVNGTIFNITSEVDLNQLILIAEGISK